MDNFLPELLDDDPIDAAVESDDDDSDVSDVAPETVPDVKKLVRAKRSKISYCRHTNTRLEPSAAVSHPEDKSLVFDFKITGKPAPNHTHVVYKRGTISNEFLNRPLEEVSILEQTLYGAGTSRLPQLCYLEGRALPEEYFFGEQPPLTPSALADIGFRAESALAAWRNMVP
ncbi:TPA: hypothetical protein ACH3X1_004924 [Trebouxia sp. C0004]